MRRLRLDYVSKYGKYRKEEEKEIDNQGRRNFNQHATVVRNSSIPGFDRRLVYRKRARAIGEGLGVLWLDHGGAASLPLSSWHVAIGGACWATSFGTAVARSRCGVEVRRRWILWSDAVTP